VRLALLGAFPFPYPQGSQVYFTEQARALAAAGAEPSLLTYASGLGESPPDLQVLRPPRWSAPTGMRSGPHPGKPVADASLLARYLSAHREHQFDAALAHNAEAALIALAARPVVRVPVIYCAHTILRFELSAYAAPRFGRGLSRIGAAIDRTIAGRSDGIIALSEDARGLLRRDARGPIRVLPPGLEPPEPASDAEKRAACERHGLEPGRFVLYSGNLDGYQELDRLAAAARRLAAQAEARGGTGVRVVVATHDAEATKPSNVHAGTLAGLAIVAVSGAAEMHALSSAAAVLVLARRRRGGFPIKLLNYMAAGRPIIAHERVAAGMTHGKNAWLLGEEADEAAWANAMTQLMANDAVMTRIGHASREHLAKHHDWSRIAEETLSFVSEVIGSASP